MTTKVKKRAQNTSPVQITLHPMFLPATGLVSATELLPFVPFKRSTLWKWAKDGRFPAPVHVSTLTRWRSEEIHEWLAQFKATNNK